MADELDNPNPSAPVTDPAPATDPASEPAKEPAKEPSTVLNAETKEPVGDWPADFREKIVNTLTSGKGDEKLLKRLERMKSPADLAKSWLELEKKLSSGELKAVKPKEMTEDEHKAWRAENGIPETPDGYLEKIKLADGLQIGEEDKPIVDKIFAAAHESDLSPEAMNKLLNAYYASQDELLAQRSEQDKQHAAAAADALRADWGSEYRSNINSLMGFLDTAPEGSKDLLLNARLGDGMALMNNQGIVQWLTGLAREANPMPTLTKAGGDPMKGIEDRISEIEGMMGTKAYTKDEKVQQEYRDLIDAREKMKSKAA